jgi:hypothetical protein
MTMKIYTKLVLDMNTNEILEEQSFNYDGPVAKLCGAGSGLTNVANQQSSAYNTMLNQAQTVFGNSSTVFNDLVNTFTPTVAAGPDQQGFSPAEVSALKSQAITQTGNSYNNAKYAAGEAQAANGGGNVADVNGGSKTATDLSVANGAAATTANEENTIDLNNYATGRQNYDTAVSGLENAPNVFGAATSAENAATGSGSSAASTQNQVAQQNQSWVQAVTGALGGIAGDVVTGGMSNLGKGVGFFGNG